MGDAHDEIGSPAIRLQRHKYLPHSRHFVSPQELEHVLYNSHRLIIKDLNFFPLHTIGSSSAVLLAQRTKLLRRVIPIRSRRDWPEMQARMIPWKSAGEPEQPPASDLSVATLQQTVNIIHEELTWHNRGVIFPSPSHPRSNLRRGLLLKAEPCPTQPSRQSRASYFFLDAMDNPQLVAIQQLILALQQTDQLLDRHEPGVVPRTQEKLMLWTVEMAAFDKSWPSAAALRRASKKKGCVATTLSPSILIAIGRK
ncbi:hypothetical protein PCASD_16893 [Puccinia coronata f. sp. avenae]|uniref:Uncharacterized protein n=1 Tax=Puccinia coronata f. sp. avenae TaxID=200324 RepID=A0A2N5SV34_9BASI|nr:hypothetical protein PCASD_16893 [Puccinia coronata f. sp. avenae]